ncbi:nudix hydrolase 11-like [Actinia tenebrosa]|uniref:Nudix hydrolase 11-like n=1 Tax=Actinia tenebrosa TaxID=6105 RepID=A0A6P8HHY1_ACTTE|nr:nudix hydrolase 11-like [Actinia tenebrosa]
MDQLEVCRGNLMSYEKSGFDREFIKYTEYQLSVTPKAAVLIPLFIKNGQIHVLLTRRSHSVGSHKGEVSFAGGREDKQDSSIVETALREAQEEVGLDPKYVEVISTWKPSWVGVGFSNSKLSLVYPVIAILKPGFIVHADSSEVSEVFDVPLEFFLSSETHEHGKLSFQGKQVCYHIFRYHNSLDIVDKNVDKSEQKEGYIIWGFTGTICMRTAVVAYGRLPSFTLVNEHEKKGLGGYINYINNDSSVCKNESKL